MAGLMRLINNNPGPANSKQMAGGHRDKSEQRPRHFFGSDRSSRSQNRCLSVCLTVPSVTNSQLS